MNKLELYSIHMQSILKNKKFEELFKLLYFENKQLDNMFIQTVLKHVSKFNTRADYILNKYFHNV